MMRRAACARIALASVVWLVGQHGQAAEPAQRPVRVGLSGSLVQDVPAPLLQAALRPFQTMIETQTGMAGEVRVVPAEQIAQQLQERKIDAAVFQGFEFAWARLRSPELVPLALAVNQQRHLTAQLVVAKERGAGSLAGLKQRSLAVPRGTRGHCLLFLERECLAAGQAHTCHFARIEAPASVEDALDDVIDGLVDAVLVDSLALECYQRRKPGRFDQLRVIQQSPCFPASVLACRPEAFPPAVQRRFQDGLLAASENPQSRRLLQLWRLTGFEAVPDDYAQTLAAIARVYPPPGEKAARDQVETASSTLSLPGR